MTAPLCFNQTPQLCRSSQPAFILAEVEDFSACVIGATKNQLAFSRWLSLQSGQDASVCDSMKLFSFSFARDRRAEPSGTCYISYPGTTPSARSCTVLPWVIVWVTLCLNDYSPFLWCWAGGNGSALLALNGTSFCLKRKSTLTFTLSVLGLLISALESECRVFHLKGYYICFFLGGVDSILCGIWVILCIDPYASSYFFRACVGS